MAYFNELQVTNNNPTYKDIQRTFRLKYWWLCIIINKKRLDIVLMDQFSTPV